MAQKKRSNLVTLKPQRKGQKKIAFRSGGLHSSTGTKSGVKISAAKHAAARAGKLGPKAAKQELFYENVLAGGGRKQSKYHSS